MSEKLDELMLIGKMYTDINDCGQISIATLNEYKEHIINTYNPSAELTKYLCVLPINTLIKCKVEDIETNVQSIYDVFGEFDKDAVISFIRAFIKLKTVSFDECVNDLNSLRDNAQNLNVLYQHLVYIALLNYSINVSNVTDIIEFTEKIKTNKPLRDKAISLIKWEKVDGEI